MQDIAELRAVARKAAIDIIVGAVTVVATELALKAINGSKAQEPAPIRIEIVMPAQKGADTMITLREAMDIKRFPVRKAHAPVQAKAVPTQNAMPLLMK